LHWFEFLRTKVLPLESSLFTAEITGTILGVKLAMGSFLFIFLGTVLAIAVITDLRFQKIPNSLTFSAMTAGIGYHVATGGLEGLVYSAAGLALGMAIFIIPFLMGGMGAGDAKLMGAIGAAVGPKGVFIAAVLTSIFGGIYALILIIIHRGVGKDIFRRWLMALRLFVFTRAVAPIPANKKVKQPKLCYGVAIAAGTLFYILLELSGYQFPMFFV
jgi:prepilin peptidase CpaA